MSIPLKADTLTRIQNAEVPAYDRPAVTPGIVHFGVGAFHRAHQAMYLDRLLASDPAAAVWGICGVGVRPADAAMRDALVPQDGLFTLTLKHPHGDIQTSVIGSIVEYLYAPDDPEKVLERLSDPSTRIVSLTVTEVGTTSPPRPASSTPRTLTSSLTSKVQHLRARCSVSSPRHSPGVANVVSPRSP